MKSFWPSCVIVVLACFALTACGGGGRASQDQQQTLLGPGGTPLSWFGVHNDWTANQPLVEAYGTVRLWDDNLRWDLFANCIPGDSHFPEAHVRPPTTIGTGVHSIPVFRTSTPGAPLAMFCLLSAASRLMPTTVMRMAQITTVSAHTLSCKTAAIRAYSLAGCPAI